jgi:hypothetical protein
MLQRNKSFANYAGIEIDGLHPDAYQYCVYGNPPFGGNVRGKNTIIETLDAAEKASTEKVFFRAVFFLPRTDSKLKGRLKHPRANTKFSCLRKKPFLIGFRGFEGAASINNGIALPPYSYIQSNGYLSPPCCFIATQLEEPYSRWGFVSYFLELFLVSSSYFLFHPFYIELRPRFSRGIYHHTAYARQPLLSKYSPYE